jgi:hypothetical protein
MLKDPLASAHSAREHARVAEFYDAAEREREE